MRFPFRIEMAIQGSLMFVMIYILSVPLNRLSLANGHDPQTPISESTPM